MALATSMKAFAGGAKLAKPPDRVSLPSGVLLLLLPLLPWKASVVLGTRAWTFCQWWCLAAWRRYVDICIVFSVAHRGASSMQPLALAACMHAVHVAMNRPWLSLTPLSHEPSPGCAGSKGKRRFQRAACRMKCCMGDTRRPSVAAMLGRWAAGTGAGAGAADASRVPRLLGRASTAVGQPSPTWGYGREHGDTTFFHLGGEPHDVIRNANSSA